MDENEERIGYFAEKNTNPAELQFFETTGDHV
jgi:hypothetical protein